MRVISQHAATAAQALHFSRKHLAAGSFLARSLSLALVQSAPAGQARRVKMVINAFSA